MAPPSSERTPEGLVYDVDCIGSERIAGRHSTGFTEDLRQRLRYHNRAWNRSTPRPVLPGSTDRARLFQGPCDSGGAGCM